MPDQAIDFAVIMTSGPDTPKQLLFERDALPLQTRNRKMASATDGGDNTN